MALSVFGCCISKDYLPADCLSSAIAGIDREVYFANYRDIIGWTQENQTLTGACPTVLTNVTMCNTACWYKVRAVAETGNVKETIAGGGVNRFANLEFTYKIIRNSCSADILAIVMATADLVAIVKDNNGIYRVLGAFRPLRNLSITTDFGTKLEDEFSTEIKLKAVNLAHESLPRLWAGVPSDTDAARDAATRVLIAGLLCNAEASDCGCVGN